MWESCACAGCREDIQAGETCIEAIAAQSIRLWFHPGCGIALASVQGWEPYD